ncbi:hypothetical protein HY498_02585 [Candidatus Woesearchaeota archaeon]|nr:hypothetical protein [Candidatus Woesearchaeota archaeon]
MQIDKESIEQYRPKLLYDENYYRSGRVAEILERIGINPLRVTRVVPSKRGDMLFNRSFLFRISLEDNQKETLGTLFAKVYHPHKPTIPTSRKKRLNLGQEYQYNLMKFWNELGIPSPIAIDYFESTEYADNVAQYKTSTLLMSAFNSPTLDLDVIAVDQLIKRINDITKAPFIGERGLLIRDNAAKDIKTLEQFKLNIVRSALDTINYVSIYCTSTLSNPESDLVKKVKDSLYKHPSDYYVEKGFYYLKIASIWFLIKNGILSLDSIKKQNGDYIIIPPQVKDFLDKYNDKLKRSFSLVSNLHRNILFESFVQGDEYLHHFYYDKNGPMLEKKVSNSDLKIFDSSYGMLGSFIRSKLPILVSHLLNFDYLTTKKLFEESQNNANSIANELKKVHLGKEVLGNFSINSKPIEESKIFDLLSVYELINTIGLYAKQDILNADAWRQSIERKVEYVPTNPELFKFSQEPYNFLPFDLTLERYSSEKAIDLMLQNLISRIDHISKTKDYQLSPPEREFVDLIKELIEYYTKTFNQNTNVSSLKQERALSDQQQVKSVI